MSINITFFYRKPSENFHSIEELFNNFLQYFSKDIVHKNIYLPHHNGFFNRIKNIFFAKKKQDQINHITGDVNYIAIGLPKKNTILTIHDIGSVIKRNFLKKYLINLFWFKIPLNRVKYITVISEFSKQEIIINFDINPEKIIIIPNCVSDKFVKTNREFNSENPNILFIGTKSNKNLELSIEALENIECKLNIIGKLTDKQIYLLEKYNINYINYVNLEFDDVIELYQNSDILLFPSFYEGFGVPILEAQATQIPVITSNLKPMNQIAGDGAIFINPYSVDEISNAIKNILNDKNLRNKIIELGIQNSTFYSSKNIANMYISLYQKILFDI